MQCARFAVTLGLTLVGACAFGQGLVQQSVDPSAVRQDPRLSGVRVDQKMGAALPLDAKFKDADGKQITFGSLFKGHPLVILPIFYRCTGVCNLELQGVLNALSKDDKIVPGRDVEVVALGINPKEGPDLAAGKKASTLDLYGKPKTADGWHFLTGDIADIRKVTDAIGFGFTYDPATDQINHPSCVVMVTPRGQISSYMLKGFYNPSAFAGDLQAAAQARIQAPSQDLFFGCIHVDPLTGKRSLEIQALLKVCGVATLAVLALSIFALSCRSRLKMA